MREERAKKEFHRCKRKVTVSLLLVACLLLSGCAGSFPFPGKEKETKEGQEALPETLGLVPDFSYERKAEKPGVWVDQLGYLPGSVKMAVFQGEELPERFQVVAKDSGECVFEGDIKLSGDRMDGILTGYGSFTEVKEEGSYYIRCDRIGCSYYFDVNSEVYLETAKEYGSIVEQAQNVETAQETVEICETVSYLLAAYEMYPELFGRIWPPGNMGGETLEPNAEEFFRMLRGKTDMLLSLQDEKTGGIYRSTERISAAGEAGETAAEELNGEATAVFAGTMAKYSYLYQEYDLDYANICLKAAAKAWRYFDMTGQGVLSENGVASGRIYAASELYRASNENLYHNYILQNREFVAEGREDLYLLLGKITYLSTRRKVDHELCGQIMSGLMKRAGNIAAGEKGELFLMADKETDAMMWDMTVLALTNYAIMNHEYVTVIENYLHYLLGRNREAAYLLEAQGSSEAAKLLLLLSVVEAERKIVEDSEAKEEPE